MKEKSFDNRIHFVGRVTVFACLACFILLPIALSVIYKTPIDYKKTFGNAFPILLSFTIAAVCENISYAPIIGPGALYTSCVTGDLSTMKVPAAVTAMDVAKVKSGTEKGKIISIIAVCVCTFVTTAIALAGMLFLAPIINPVFENPYIKPAFDNLLPAIYGSLIIPKIFADPKQNFPIFVVPLVLFLIMKAELFIKNQGFIIVGLVVLSIFYSRLVHKDEISAKSQEQDQQ